MLRSARSPALYAEGLFKSIIAPGRGYKSPLPPSPEFLGGEHSGCSLTPQAHYFPEKLVRKGPLNLPLFKPQAHHYPSVAKKLP